MRFLRNSLGFRLYISVFAATVHLQVHAVLCQSGSVMQMIDRRRVLSGVHFSTLDCSQNHAPLPHITIQCIRLLSEFAVAVIFSADVVQAQIRQRGIKVWTGLGRYYRRLDEQHDARLNKYELEKGLIDFHIEVPQEVRVLVRIRQTCTDRACEDHAFTHSWVMFVKGGL